MLIEIRHHHCSDAADSLLIIVYSNVCLCMCVCMCVCVHRHSWHAKMSFGVHLRLDGKGIFVVCGVRNRKMGDDSCVFMRIFCWAFNVMEAVMEQYRLLHAAREHPKSESLKVSLLDHMGKKQPHSLMKTFSVWILNHFLLQVRNSHPRWCVEKWWCFETDSVDFRLLSFHKSSPVRSSAWYDFNQQIE